MFSWRRKREEDLERELRSHLDLECEEQGDVHAARKLFGNSTLVKEECRDVYAWPGFTRVVEDLKYAWRSLKKTPGFAATAILVLTLGIGSTLAIFRLIDPLFLRPLPVGRPQELVRIGSRDKNGIESGIRSRVLDTLRKEGIFRGVCGFAPASIPSDVYGPIQAVPVLPMTGDCFSTLGVQTQIGRPFTLDDDRQGAERVAVLTDSLWRIAFASRADVLGQKIRLGGENFTVIGVAETRFSGLSPGSPLALIVPLNQTVFGAPPAGSGPIYFWVNIFARRAPGVSVQQTNARMGVLEKQLLEESVPLRYNPTQRNDYLSRRITVAAAGNSTDRRLRDRFGKPLYAIFGICSLVLTITCINLSVLLLARGLRRNQEFAVRLALGAGRSSVARLLAFESVLLVLGGAAGGMIFSNWAVRITSVEASAALALKLDSPFDLHSALFFAGLILMVALGLAAMPICQAADFHRSHLLRGSGRGIVGSSTSNQKVLLTVQVALTLALVYAGGALASSLKHLYEIDLGVKTQHVSMGMLRPLPEGNRGAAMKPYYQELLAQVEAVPGVTSASLTDFAPLWAIRDLAAIELADGAQPRSDLRGLTVSVTESFFETMGIPIVEGESFRTGDSEASERSAIVSQSLAELLGPGGLIGRHVRVGNAEAYSSLKIVGIAGNAQMSLAEPDQASPITVYVNMWEHPDTQPYPALLIKTASKEPLSAEFLRRMIQSRGRQYMADYQTLDHAKDTALIENSLLAYVSTGFGGLTLALAAIGLFGVLSYHVASRTSEIGLRMALGAERFQVRWLIVRQIVPTIGSGIAIGLVLTFTLGKPMSGLVFGTSVYNPALLGASVIVLMATAMLAAWIPAQRAAKVDPNVALRSE